MGRVGEHHLSGFLGLLVASSAAGLDVQTITCGRDGGAGSWRTGFISGTIGSLTDGTSDIYSGAVITELYWDQTTATVILKITGTLANSGWTTMERLGSGETYSRAAATFATSGGFSTWTWTAGSFQAMGNNGSTSTVVFT